jgi:vacuolar protein sorting-associated protein 35
MQEFDESNQEIYLEQHIEVVRQQSFYMKKSLDQGNLREALKYSSTMLGEMKTSKLTPRNYFNLCTC